MPSPTIDDFNPALCQATLFTPDNDVAASRFMRELHSDWSERFDGEPAILPSAPGLPNDVPRVMLKDSSGAWKAQIAPGRVNVLWSAPQYGPNQVVEFYAYASDLLQSYADRLAVRVGRLAAVIHRYLVAANPGQLLAEHFCRDRWLREPFNRAEGFELHAHKKYEPAEQWEVNSWVRCRTGFIFPNEPRQAASVVVEQDINTLTEVAATKSYEGVDIDAFFKLAPAEFDKIFALYFPREEVT